MDEEILYHALDAVDDSVLIVDSDLRILFTNRRFLEQMETQTEDVSGEYLSRICDAEMVGELLDHLADVQEHGTMTEFTGRNILNRHDNTETIRCTPIGGSPDQQGMTHIIISARSAVPSATAPPGDNRFEFQDPVTGLLNRRSIAIVTNREIKRADRGTPNLAMLFLMLRNFKQINQMHGHSVGDLLLENTGIRVREAIRKSDYVFRWEGTNLVVLLPELATPLDALIVAEKIQSAVTVPYRFRGLDLAPDCHIGISIYPNDATDVDDLFNCANSAVVEAERQQVPVLHFDRVTHQAASDRLYLRTGLQRAFERGELELFYQPIVDLHGKIRGAEALMRWNHPDRGILSPASFIPIAEDSRLIAPIDKLALYTAARTIVEWSQQHDLFITINISALNISDSTLPVVVAQALSDAGLTDTSRLKLELTESRTVEGGAYSQAGMTQLNEMGVDIWIDDFGTGQSSLSYLKHLPVSTVKIDKDFIAELGRSSQDIDYLKGIINTIRSRGKSVVVEGVTTEEQFLLLKELPVDYLQGFYFGKPVTEQAFLKLLKGSGILP